MRSDWNLKPGTTQRHIDEMYQQRREQKDAELIASLRDELKPEADEED